VKNTTQPSIITVTIFEVFIKWYYLNCQLSNLIPTYSQTRMIQTALVVKKTLSCRYSYGSHLRTVHKMYIRGPKKNDLSISTDIDESSLQEIIQQFKRISKTHQHKIDLKPLIDQSKYEPNMKLDTSNNPDNSSCGFCKLTFQKKKNVILMFT
jgi:hypothetical protein